MTRRKLEMKKIENTTARQVTFSKRRRGLFKKALELSTLCDADLALLVFSATGKLFDFSSPSMQQVIERRQNLHSKNLNKMDQPSLELQIDNSAKTLSSNETVERTHGMRQMIGEVLQRLNVEELQKLEELLEVGLSRVLNTKDERFLGEISALKRKEAQLMEDNQCLKQMEKQLKIKIHAIEQGQSSESIINICSSSYPPQHQDNEDTSLKLGLWGSMLFKKALGLFPLRC
ncbi:MADS-box protein JOINTLESS-like isoform X2 [Corylus avellana]|uniref:MADS-box protein JOINTLESS-like isoform X2 n=1 Tax=Corylus avellana TaxID=13451 RepID=UPI00286B87A2|nr:MADS-box protein JOINTLESS-like isoform X2 [Corylus avellana]XP_059446246.1 MADS-box protein JOINTLESS-like isoform X2 [Corylus avellana]